ncbi:TonB-dependent receptor [bacterium]|nr:TonB-dependent receptor [bacterium]
MKGKGSIFAFLLVCFSMTGVLFSQTTGKIKGKVTDATNGKALEYANVVIEGTSRGTATDKNGEFTILNVPPGTYTLRVLYMGYQTKQIENVRVSVNRTSYYDIELNQSVVELAPVVVQASVVSMKKDQTSSIRNVSSEQIDVMPIENIGAAISMQAGVVEGHFRGGRLTEVAYLIDGIPVTESFGGAGKSVDLEPEAVADLEVITGTFNAEYGQAMSGIVNAVTKGGSSTFHGMISGQLGNYFTPNKDIFIGLDDGELTRNQDYKMSMSGPILGNKLSFFANVRYQDNKNHLNGLRRFNPGDYSNFESVDPADWYSEHTGDGAYVPMNKSKNLSVMTKITALPFNGFRTSLLATYNRDNWFGYDHAFKYNPDGMSSTHRESGIAALEINHLLTKRMFYELKLSAMRHDHGYYLFENPFDEGYLHDRFLRNTGPGFFTGGQNKDHDIRIKTEYSGKFDFSWQITQQHNIKTGAHLILHDLDNQYHQIRNYYYGTQWENELYVPSILPDSSIYSDVYRVKPVEFAAYIQDKMEFDEMVINVGLRYEYFNPKTVYPSQRRNPANQLDFPDDPEKMSEYPDADAKIQLSPRFGLAYQLGEAALLRFSYGHFRKMPPLYALYQNHAFQVAPADYATTMGNAQIKPEKTIQYEIGLWQQLMEGMGMEVALYYRDIYDMLSAKVITTFNQIEYGLYSNKDYGNAKGLELKFDFVRGSFSSYLNYTLQYTRGNADNPLQTFTRAGNSMDPIPRLIPMSWDQRHTFNLTIGYNTAAYGATMTGYYNSGSPYTWSPVSESMLSRVNLYPNNAAAPSRFSVDLAGYYNIPIPGPFKAKLVLNVYNLFDTLNEVWVNAETGRAYTAIIRDTDIAAHHSDFNTFEDVVQNPSMYASPRLIKAGLELMF